MNVLAVVIAVVAQGAPVLEVEAKVTAPRAPASEERKEIAASGQGRVQIVSEETTEPPPKESHVIADALAAHLKKQGWTVVTRGITNWWVGVRSHYVTTANAGEVDVELRGNAGATLIRLHQVLQGMPKTSAAKLRTKLTPELARVVHEQLLRALRGELVPPRSTLRVRVAGDDPDAIAQQIFSAAKVSEVRLESADAGRVALRVTYDGDEDALKAAVGEVLDAGVEFEPIAP